MPIGGAPLPVILFGEELVLFRDDEGRLGLIDRPLRSPRRRPELRQTRRRRLALHLSWLALRRERQDHRHAGRRRRRQEVFAIRFVTKPIRSRSARESSSLTWDPGEPPLFPSYQFLNSPPDRSFAIKLYSECNYLQGNEGNIDLAHLSFLHYNQNTFARYGVGAGLEQLNSRGAAPGRKPTTRN